MISDSSATITYWDEPLEATVSAAKQGDRAAFGRLIERYERAVYATVYRRLRNHAESQELCQEVFIQAMRKIGQLQEACCFGSWLRSIAGRMAINQAMRRRAVASIDADRLESRPDETNSPLTAMILRERRDSVRRGLKRLGPMDRQTLTAFYFDGSSLLEMSRRFASPVGTIKRRLHVARKRLAKALETEG